MEEKKDDKAHEVPAGGSQTWEFCEICATMRIALSCFLVLSRFRYEGQNIFALAKQFLTIDKNGNLVVKYSKNAIRFYNLRSMREAAAMLQQVADRFDDKSEDLQ